MKIGFGFKNEWKTPTIHFVSLAMHNSPAQFYIEFVFIGIAGIFVIIKNDKIVPEERS